MKYIRSALMAFFITCIAIAIVAAEGLSTDVSDSYSRCDVFLAKALEEINSSLSTHRRVDMVLNLAFEPTTGIDIKPEDGMNGYGGVTESGIAESMTIFRAKDREGRILEQGMRDGEEPNISYRRYLGKDGRISWASYSTSSQSNDRRERWFEFDQGTGKSKGVEIVAREARGEYRILAALRTDGKPERLSFSMTDPEGKTLLDLLFTFDKSGQANKVIIADPEAPTQISVFDAYAPGSGVNPIRRVTFLDLQKGFLGATHYSAQGQLIARDTFENSRYMRMYQDASGAIIRTLAIQSFTPPSYFEAIREGGKLTWQPKIVNAPLPSPESAHDLVSKLPRLILIEPDAAGIDAWIGGKRVGVAPCVVPIDGSADLQIILSAKGYRPQTLGLKPGAQVEMVAAEMGPYDIAQRKIRIVTSPTSGVDVSIGGKKVGTTPYVLAFSENRAYSLLIAKNGIKSKISIDDTKPGDSTIDLAFDAEPRSLTVRSKPKGAGVSVNGTLLGTTPFTGTVYGGQQRIIVAKTDRKTHAETTAVPPGASISIDAKLPYDLGGKIEDLWSTARFEAERKRSELATVGLGLGGAYRTFREPGIAALAPGAAGGSFSALIHPNTAGLAWGLGLDVGMGNIDFSLGPGYSEFLVSFKIGPEFWIGSWLSPYLVAGGGIGFVDVRLEDSDPGLAFQAIPLLEAGARLALKPGFSLIGFYAVEPRIAGFEGWNERFGAIAVFGLNPGDR